MSNQNFLQANILIVDDHQENINILAEFLCLEGYTNYASTRDPRTVLALVASFKPDLILLDLSMPHMSGIEVLDSLKKIVPANEFLPILVLTADVSPKSKQDALSKGAHDFLTKPFHLVEVGLRIKNLLYTRSLQQQLIQQNITLAKTVLKQTGELQIQKRKLTIVKEIAESIDQLKSQFLALVSHEVRTPLNGILGIASMLAVDDSLSKDERNEFVNLLSASGERLINTMDNIIDMSLLNSGDVHVSMQPVKIATGLLLVKEQFLEKSLRKKLALKVKVPDNIEEVTLFTDPQLLWKIISHLVDNAIKFTVEGEVTFGFSLRKSLVEFFVTDTGIGICKTAAEKIFKPFTQENGYHEREHEGIGLGLSIVKGFLKCLSGKMEVKSYKAVGSSFFFTLPLGAASINLIQNLPQTD